MSNICSKSQYAKWEGAEDTTIKNYLKMIAEHFEYALCNFDNDFNL